MAPGDHPLSPAGKIKQQKLQLLGERSRRTWGWIPVIMLLEIVNGLGECAEDLLWYMTAASVGMKHNSNYF